MILYEPNNRILIYFMSAAIYIVVHGKLKMADIRNANYTMIVSKQHCKIC